MGKGLGCFSSVATGRERFSFVTLPMAAASATSIPAARSHKPACASPEDFMVRKRKCSNLFLLKNLPSGLRACSAPHNTRLWEEINPCLLTQSLDSEEKCYLWHITCLCANHCFFWPEIPFQLRRGVPRKADMNSRAQSGAPSWLSPSLPVISFAAGALF